MVEQKGNEHPGIFVVRRKWFFEFEGVAAGRTIGVVCQHGTGRHEFVVNLGYGHQIPFTCESGGRAPDGPCDLEDFRIKNHGWVSPTAVRDKKMHPHRAGGGSQIDE